MAEELIFLDHKHISVEQMKMRVNREVEIPDTHIPSSMRRVYYHFGGHPVTIRITGGWVHTHRTYIIEMIGGYLMSDLSRNLVHLRWLLKLIDFRTVGELSWGFALLAKLYREMCKATPPNKAKIGGCLSLLQSWAQFHFPFLRPRVNHPYIFPLIMRWKHSTSYVGIPTALEDIRLLLDQRSEAQEPEVLDDQHRIDLRQTNMNWLDPWQAIFAVGRAEMSANSCRKGTMGPFKSKDKG
ncbi:hypothetical protein CXB51_007796 [Gossypium anomalum]|uniref:Aminotransferase-like plant mobile domain-containing protein n=1 Tax=Gossypium anomalum TaxID=47600 RepID=A0A8J6DA26_9ROSI|nr:hypothetical protein CXB51_007796 [Gossypium anomalum]